ncbi:YibE/F family protein [Clostridium perfringens]|nr:YibE/F family protein [Clostridium perfringens]
MKNKNKFKLSFTIILITLILLGVLYLNNLNLWKNSNISEVKAKVLNVDNNGITQAGISKIGEQHLKVKILSGDFKGEEINATNFLSGKLEMDTYYEDEDTIVLALQVGNEGDIIGAKAMDLYRQGWQGLLFLMFIICLIFYAGYTGVKALFSFVASLFIIWEILIPMLLKGVNPLIISTIVLILLSAIIIFSVAGITKKGVSAFIGTISGLIVTIGITLFFGEKLNLNGMTQNFAETLIFSGYINIDMKHVFYAAVIIGAAGAAMDIAMDVSASMEEIKEKKPDINRKELIASGFNIGRSVIGTMSTTLLLAYSGGYLTLLMLFMSQNSSFTRIINLQMVSSEIMRTVVGSIGLVLVAPITAIVSGFMLTTQFSLNKYASKIIIKDGI